MAVLPIPADQVPLILQDLLFRLKVRDVMTRELITVRRTDSMRYARALMKSHGITGLPVAERDRLYGIVSMDDVITVMEHGQLDEPVGAHMTERVVVLEDDMPLSFGASYFEKYRFGRFPVLDRDGRLCGILTSRDISASLLIELYKEYARLEAKMPAPAPCAVPVEQLRFAVRRYDFENAGRAAHEIKKALTARGLPPEHVRRAAIAAYEMEMNLVVHSNGGAIEARIEHGVAEITATDDGPGIPDVELAMQDGFSTANDWVRSLGFGAGMGLGNIRRVADEFAIRSAVGEGTRVRALIRWPVSAVTMPPEASR
ncbi:MAG: CBS domain-containing protein [Kiritimatiellae bacterium]|nr:CBS domain-containing protein [Kiritimatiellia bacterium]